MSSLDRAKRFLASKAAKLAMAAVPLAVAVPAAFGQTSSQSNIVVANTFNFSNAAGCSVLSGSGTCSLEQQSTIGGNPLGNWVDDYTSGIITPSVNGNINLVTSGSASGTLTGSETIPVSWDFNLAAQVQVSFESPGVSEASVAPTANVTLEWILLDSASADIFLTENLGTLTAGNYAGSATFTLPSSFSGSGTTGLSGYSIETSVTSDTSLDLSVPQGTSIDFNNTVSATPEPATFALTGAGLLGLLRLRRRRKA